jgi:hypothetical protein
MKTAELTGAALDWAVAKCEKPEWLGNQAEVYVLKAGFHPSTDWAQGGPIIEREEISMAKVGRSVDDVIAPHPEGWAAHIDGAHTCYGTTPLIAAMRCYVASKLGDEVELPEGFK